MSSDLNNETISSQSHLDSQLEVMMYGQALMYNDLMWVQVLMQDWKIKILSFQNQLKNYRIVLAGLAQ